MKQISQLALDKISANNHQVIGRMVVAFDKHYKTIENWIEDNDVRLTTPRALEIISEVTGLSESEILTEPVSA